MRLIVILLLMGLCGCSNSLEVSCDGVDYVPVSMTSLEKLFPERELVIKDIITGKEYRDIEAYIMVYEKKIDTKILEERRKFE